MAQRRRVFRGHALSPAQFQVPLPSWWESLDPGQSIHCLEAGLGGLEPKGLEAAGKQQEEHSFPQEARRLRKLGESMEGTTLMGLFLLHSVTTAEPETMAKPAQVRSLSPPEGCALPFLGS